MFASPRVPARGWDVSGPTGFRISICNALCWREIDIEIGAPGACLSALVKASWVIRYAV
ncbi:Uncharacterised protein [Mycobacteroides abscessus subsp. abscessus]|nr:Uncharacterised protein [Mycobacteroides abscessus subsp. abscessus]